MTKPAAASAAVNKTGASLAKGKDQHDPKKVEEKRPEQRKEDKSKSTGHKAKR